MCPAWSMLLHQEEIHSSGQKKDILTYPTSDILRQIEAPVPTNQRGHYSIASENVDKIEKTTQ